MEEIGIKEGIILALFGAIYAIWKFIASKLDSKIEKETNDREAADEKIMATLKEEINETVLAFKEGVKDEIGFRNGVMAKHEAHIDKIIDKIEIISSGQTSLENIVQLNMEHQAEICRLKHEDVASMKLALQNAVEKQERINKEQHPGG